jgi:hypothetical protein
MGRSSFRISEKRISDKEKGKKVNRFWIFWIRFNFVEILGFDFCFVFGFLSLILLKLWVVVVEVLMILKFWVSISWFDDFDDVEILGNRGRRREILSC